MEAASGPLEWLLERLGFIDGGSPASHHGAVNHGPAGTNGDDVTTLPDVPVWGFRNPFGSPLTDGITNSLLQMFYTRNARGEGAAQSRQIDARRAVGLVTSSFVERLKGSWAPISRVTTGIRDFGWNTSRSWAGDNGNILITAVSDRFGITPPRQEIVDRQVQNLGKDLNRVGTALADTSVRVVSGQTTWGEEATAFTVSALRSGYTDTSDWHQTNIADPLRRGDYETAYGNAARMSGEVQTEALLAVAPFGTKGVNFAVRSGSVVSRGAMTFEDVARLEAAWGRGAAETSPLFSRIAPGGGLAAHEAAGGHLLLKHVGQSEFQLLARLASEPKISGSSSFFDRTIAERAVAETLDANSGNIATWLGGNSNRLGIDHTFSGPVGISVMRGASSAAEVNSVYLRLVRDANMSTGYRIQTGFPRP